MTGTLLYTAHSLSVPSTNSVISMQASSSLPPPLLPYPDLVLLLHATPRYNQREGRTALEVLSDFRSATPPLERLLEAAPPLRPRLFSIASAPALRGRTAHLLVALVRYNTPYKRVKRGLCSSYLEGLRPQDDVSTAWGCSLFPVGWQHSVALLPLPLATHTQTIRVAFSLVSKRYLAVSKPESRAQ